MLADRIKAALFLLAASAAFVLLLFAFFLVAVGAGWPGVFVFAIFVGCGLWGVATGVQSRLLRKSRLRATPPLRAE